MNLNLEQAIVTAWVRSRGHLHRFLNSPELQSKLAAVERAGAQAARADGRSDEDSRMAGHHRRR